MGYWGMVSLCHFCKPLAPDGSKGREASDETVMISNLVLKIFTTRVQFIHFPSNNDLASFKCAVISGVPMEHNANEEMTALKYRRRWQFTALWKTSVRPGLKSRRCPVGLWICSPLQPGIMTYQLHTRNTHPRDPLQAHEAPWCVKVS